MLENWRVVVGFPGYEVSDLGRLRSVDRIAPRVLPNGATGMSLRGRILPGRVRRNGSRPVAVLFNLYRGGKMYQTVRLHRLVLARADPRPHRVIETVLPEVVRDPGGWVYRYPRPGGGAAG